jgi:predicted dehydrogenase
VNRIDAPQEVWKRGNAYVAEKSPAAGRATRLPSGHPEAFLEAFANHYCNFADAVRARIERRKADPLVLDFPGVQDGIRGMRFIEAVVKSSARGAKWVRM